MEWSVDCSADNSNIHGPFSSTMMYPSKSTPNKMPRYLSSVCQGIRKSPVCRLEFDDDVETSATSIAVDNSADLSDTTMVEAEGQQLKRLISDKVMAIFNFDDSDDSMDTHEDSLHTPKSKRPSLTSVENNKMYTAVGRSPSIKQQTVVSGHKSSQGKTVRSVRGHSKREDNNTEYQSTYNSQKRRYKESSHQSKSTRQQQEALGKTRNDTVNSDSSSFMQKPLCKKGVSWQNMDKSRKRSILSKLKKIGRHLHQHSKNNGCLDQVETLAVL